MSRLMLMCRAGVHGLWKASAAGRGVPESVVDELKEKATEELEGARHGTYIRLQRVIARSGRVGLRQR